jgi:hypothetical protein
MWAEAYALIMRRKRAVAVIIVAIVVAAVGLTSYLFFSFEPPQIESVTVSSVDSISLSGFNLTLSVKINNPNAHSMTIKGIKYNLVLSKTNQLLMNGTFGEINLPAHASTEILAKASVYFAPTINLAYMTIFEKSVMIEINGVGTAQGLFSDQSFSFSRSFDAYPWISEKIGSLVSTGL